MKQIVLAAGLAGIGCVAMAQTADPAIDVNGDGFYSYPELGIFAPEVSTESFGVMDTNGDGLLDMDEVAAAKMAGLFPEIE